MEGIFTNQKPIARVGLIGCGNIASLWDETPSTANHAPKTHAAAFFRDSRFQLSSFFDLSLERATTACKFWDGTFATDSFAEFLQQDLDILCLCVPENARLALLQQIPTDRKYVVVSEKPLCSNLAEGSEIVRIVQNASWKFIVNYIRRYGQGFQELKSMIEQDSFGAAQKISACYGKGLRNNGSHLLDLLNYFFGSPISVQWMGTVQDDRLDLDPTFEVLLQYQHQGQVFPVYLTGADHREYTLFEFQIFFSKSRITVSDRGEKIALEKAVNDPQYPGYKILQSDQNLRSGLENYFPNLVSEVYALYSGSKNEGSSTASSAFELLKIISSVEDSKKQNGIKVFLK